MPKIIENKLIEEFKDRDSFSREELFKFFREYEPDLKESTFGWRIYDLKNKNIIKTLKRGLYSVADKPGFKPVFSAELLKITKKIQENFKEVKYCIWETDWINEFSQHQSVKRMLLIEIEKDFVGSLYYYLKDNFNFDFYLNPDNKAINYYISESKFPVVIKKLITRSPLGKKAENKLKISTPLLEKILVDLFTEEKLFYFYQGSELVKIFESAVTRYSINFTKLFSYAARREREQDIKSFLLENMSYLLNDVLDV